MRHIRVDTDIQPLSEFRIKTAFYLKQMNENRRPLILTQNGKSAAVVLSVIDYDNMMEKLELIEDIKLAEHQIESGLGIEHSSILNLIKGKI